MSRFTAHEHRPDALTQFAEELRQLAETVLERVEPALRSASEDRPEWSSCSWCPVCASAALLRGEHHDVLTAIADHGTAIVTVLREALAGAPVEPVLPTDEHADPNPHHDSRVPTGAAPTADENTTEGPSAAGPGTMRNSGPAGNPRSTGKPRAAGNPYATGNSGAAGDPGTTGNSKTAGDAAHGSASADTSADTDSTHEHTASRRGDNRSGDHTGGVGEPTRSGRHPGSPRKRSGYTDIPVTIRT